MITIQKPDGSRQTISDADLAEALTHGYLPVEKVRPAFDSATEQLVMDRTEKETSRVVDYYRVEALPAPMSVTPRQMRLALLAHGVPIANIPAMLPDDAARVEWEYALEFRRDNPLVIQFAGVLQLDIEAVFREAALL